MAEFFMICDLVCSSDPEGRTYRQINAAKQHTVPIGALVELESGARLFVVRHTRDCDQTPLYNLSHDAEDTVQEDSRFCNRSWTGGYSEDSFEVIRLPGTTTDEDPA